MPSDIDPRCVGAAVRALAELELIRRAGLTRSQRPEAQSRDIPVCVIADGALAWLADRPDLPEPNAEPAQHALWD
jgi:hypothetical protein